MFFDLETGEHADCTGINIDPTHNVFSPVLIYQRGKNVQYARMVGLGHCNAKNIYSFVIRMIGGDPAALARVLLGSPDVTIYSGEVTEEGRIELLAFVREQSVSLTAHRYGRLDPALADLRL
jgi:hypothetical protein